MLAIVPCFMRDVAMAPAHYSHSNNVVHHRVVCNNTTGCAQVKLCDADDRDVDDFIHPRPWLILE
jgi:hypothetical protein